MLDEINLSILDKEQLLLVARALNSPHRIEILEIISHKSLNITDLAKELNRPFSSTRLDLDILQQAGLIKIETLYNDIGKNTIAYRTFDKITMKFCYPDEYDQTQAEHQYSIPIGSYINFYDIEVPCGMNGETSPLGCDNDESLFYAPQRFQAEQIWMTSGFLEYRIKRPANYKDIKSIEISFESCSEAPLHNNEFKSDISLYINDMLIGDWCSPGDFGGMRGILTPSFWPVEMTQYGILNSWKIDHVNSTVNNKFVSYMRIQNLNLEALPYISIKIGVDKNAKHKGGINLFGEKFGNYPQNILVKIKT